MVELRAAVIIGSGSASFEMLRYLVEVLPAMVTPRWVDTRCQPVAVRDVLHYLVEALSADVAGRVLDVGGPEVMTYRDMMTQYAEVAGLRKRLIVPVPLLTPGLVVTLDRAGHADPAVVGPAADREPGQRRRSSPGTLRPT